MKAPCGRDCPDRKEACSLSCERWAEYVAERDKGYAERVMKCESATYYANKASRIEHRKYRQRRR